MAGQATSAGPPDSPLQVFVLEQFADPGRRTVLDQAGYNLPCGPSWDLKSTRELIPDDKPVVFFLDRMAEPGIQDVLSVCNQLAQLARPVLPAERGASH